MDVMKSDLVSQVMHVHKHNSKILSISFSASCRLLFLVTSFKDFKTSYIQEEEEPSFRFGGDLKESLIDCCNLGFDTSKAG